MQNLNTLILAIESSCDDTSCAVLKGNKVLSNVIASQEIHKKYGGVVPELASRDHQRNIVPVVESALEQAQVSAANLEAIAVTRGPGLLGSLLVGLSFAKSLSAALDIPLIEVNHMNAHILAHFIGDGPHPSFPFICLTVSGGHTQIVRVDDHLSHTLLGETIDDAAGEAFDKAAKILGLPYPGGPELDRLAKSGDAQRFTFANTKVPGYDYSFSGIKTSFLYFIQEQVRKDQDFIPKNIADICASYQRHLVGALLRNVTRVLSDTGIRQLAVAGGVSANSLLRSELVSLGRSKGVDIFIPPFEYCTDNAAMIGIAGLYKFRAGRFAGLDLTPAARLSL